MMSTRLMLILFVGSILFYQQCLSGFFNMGPMNTCFGYNCPNGTMGCRKHSVLTDDKKSIKADISCTDSRGNVLYRHEETSPAEGFLAKADYYEGISYQGIFSLGPSKPVKTDLNSSTFYEETPKIQ